MIQEAETENTLIFKCPVCGSGHITIEKDGKHQYGYCDACGAAYIHYVPLPHQLEFHKSRAKIKIMLGGMGSAKSRAGVNEIIDHALSVPNGKTVMFAQTLKQLSKAIMPIFDEYLPRKFVEKWTDTKQDIEIILKNGHTILGLASDDEEKIRSMDITAFYIEEASGVDPKIYKECIRRLRNKAGIINGVSHYVGLLVSNPSHGYLRDLLFTASKIYGSASIQNTVAMYKDRVKKPNPEIEAFLSSSRDNPYLPPGFVETVERSLTPEEARLYIDCIIEYAVGAVYPNILNMVEDDFDIPKNWEVYLAHDPGINDPAAILMGAIDPETGVVHFFREYYQKNKVASQVASAFYEMTKDIAPGMLHTPLIDPSANKRSQIVPRTYKQQMQIEHGIVFKLANNALEDGIQKVKNMMYNGKVRFFRSLTNTIWEGCEYRYPTEEERNKNKNLGEKPLDKNNHLMDCLRYICQEIPYDYLNMKHTSYASYADFFKTMNQKPKEQRENAMRNLLKDMYQESVEETAKERRGKRHSGGYRLC